MIPNNINAGDSLNNSENRKIDDIFNEPEPESSDEIVID